MKRTSAPRTIIVFLLLCFLSLSVSAQNPSDIRYRTTPGEGIEVSLDGGTTFSARSNGLPVRVVYPFTGEEYRSITSIGVDPGNYARAAVAIHDEVYTTEDAGETWISLPLPQNLNRNSNITAIAPSPHSYDHYLLGTSFTGFFETRDGGQTWKQLTENGLFNFKRRGAGFAEEISGLAYDPANPETILFELGFGEGLYRAEQESPGGDVILIEELSPSDQAARAETAVIPDDSYRPHPLILSGLQRRPAQDTPEKQQRLRLAENRTGIFLNPHQAQSPRLEQHIEFMLEHDMNSVVIDFKDDVGWLTYNSQLPKAQEIGSVFARFDAAQLIETLHENDIYVIARLVVFKDNRLFRYDDYRYAVWDKVNDRPWGDYRTETNEDGSERTYIREHWVDTYSEDVWRYNIDIAKELEDLGVDEIQFDYIRFPSDGPIRNAQHRFEREGMRRVDALTSFLRMARQEITVPIGTDVFGFNAWYRTGYLGQDLESLSEYVDVVSPMSYPSHFSRDFYRDMTYFDRAEFIYYEGTKRAVEMVGESVLIRPYVQAFLIGGELNYNREQYTDYLHRQLEGSMRSPGSGWTLWNMSGRYYMVTEPLQPFTRISPRSGGGE